MRSTSVIAFRDDAADLGRLILDALEVAVEQDRWEVADRLVGSLEELEGKGGGPDSLDSAYGSVARMIDEKASVRRDP